MPCPQIHVVNSDLRVNGAIAPDEIQIPDGTFADRNFIPYAGLPEELLEHQQAVSYWQANGMDVEAETVVVHTFRRAATILAVSVVPVASPVGLKTISVDVRRGNAGGNYATILTAPVAIAASDTARRAKAGTLAVASTPIAEGDSLQIVITVAGASGTQGQGLNVIVWVRENG